MTPGAAAPTTAPIPEAEPVDSGQPAGQSVGTLLSVNVGLPKDVSWQGRTVFTGVFKDPVAGPRRVRRLNVDGDGQGDLAGHGGEQRAVFVYQMDSYRHWERELGETTSSMDSSARTSPWKDSATTRCASAIATRSAARSSRSRNLASPVTASGSA